MVFIVLCTQHQMKVRASGDVGQRAAQVHNNMMEYIIETTVYAP